MKRPCGVAAEAITGTERRQLAHRCFGNLPEKDSLLKDVLDLNEDKKKKRAKEMNRFREKKMGSKREKCRQ